MSAPASRRRRWSMLVAGLLVLQLAGAAAAQVAGDLRRLEAAVEAAEGVRAIKRLQHAYAHYQEAGQWDAIAALFSKDATAQLQGRQLSGAGEIKAQLMKAAGRRANGLAPGQLNVHLILQPLVTLGADGRTARATWHEMALLGQHGQAASWEGHVQENDYVLEDGVWKIRRLRSFEQYRGSYDDYGHKAPPRWDIPYHFDAKDVGVTIPASALERMPAGGAGPAQLARRVAHLEDETAVQNLQHAFGYYLDRHLWDDVAELFAAEGRFEIASRGAWVGPAHIREALEAMYGPPKLATGELFDHILMSTVVTVAPDGLSARARSIQLAQIGRNGEFARWEQGLYENQFVKEGGTWKLQALRYFPRLITDYDAGWARDAQAVPAVPASSPPDRPSAFAHWQPYPAAQAVGFHFDHPVTGRPVRTSGPGAAVERLAGGAGGARDLRAGDPAADVPALLRRIEAVIGVDATENLMSSYGYYIDESAWDEMADTYARSGSKEITGAGVYVGPDRIRHVLKLRGPLGGRRPDFFTIHQLTQPVIHVAADGRSARARVRLFQAGGNADGSSGSWIGGIYENTAVKQDGEWKFGVQDLHHSFNASYRNGWARVGPAIRGRPLAGRAPSPRDVQGGGIAQGLGGASPANRFASQFPPDRPIRARQYSFPEISEPAFHYRNPVSGRTPADLLQH